MENRQLIDTLSNCIINCLHCADACLNEDNVEKMAPCIKLDRECAAICEAAMKLLVQDAQFSSEIVNLCEEVCTACADECEQHEAPHCQACAKACRECAEACKSN